MQEQKVNLGYKAKLQIRCNRCVNCKQSAGFKQSVIFTHIVITSTRPIFLSPASLPAPTPPGWTWKIQMVSPQPTTTSSHLLFCVDCFEKSDERPFATSPRGVLDVGSSSTSRLSLSNHSARAFHTPAMSSHPSRFGLSLWLMRFHSN